MSDTQKRWSELEKKFETVADGLGKPIDKGIFETVVALNAWEIPTRQSCEGHLERGVAAPWVDILVEGDEVYESTLKKAKDLRFKGREELQKGNREAGAKLMKENRELLWTIKEPNVKIAEKLFDLLKEFYNGRDSTLLNRLIITGLGYGARLESQGEFFQEIQNKDEKAKRLQSFQLEMKDFTIFLKEKYLKGEK